MRRWRFEDNNNRGAREMGVLGNLVASYCEVDMSRDVARVPAGTADSVGDNNRRRNTSNKSAEGLIVRGIWVEDKSQAVGWLGIHKTFRQPEETMTGGATSPSRVQWKSYRGWFRC
jgi:hypothetical protein